MWFPATRSSWLDRRCPRGIEEAGYFASLVIRNSTFRQNAAAQSFSAQNEVPGGPTTAGFMCRTHSGQDHQIVVWSSLGPYQQPSSSAWAATVVFLTIRRGRAACGLEGNSWKSDDFGVLADPPNSQLSCCCLPDTELPSDDLQMLPGGHQPMSKNHLVTVKFFLFCKTSARRVKMQLPITNAAAWPPAELPRWSILGCVTIVLVFVLHYMVWRTPAVLKYTLSVVLEVCSLCWNLNMLAAKNS